MSKRYKSKKRSTIDKEKSNLLLKEFKPRTINQSNYVRSIIECDLVLCNGPAGCGKTACAVGIGVDYLYNNKVEKLVITRPIVEASHKSIGALPGNVRDKVAPYLIPLYEELESYLGKMRLERYIAEGKIDICPLELMRGRTFDNSFLILDEAQNALYEQIKLFITRLGNGSKAIINGDVNQTDLPLRLAGGLKEFLFIFNGISDIAISNLDNSDIQRHPIVAKALSIMEEYERR